METTNFEITGTWLAVCRSGFGHGAYVTASDPADPVQFAMTTADSPTAAATAPDAATRGHDLERDGTQWLHIAPLDILWLRSSGRPLTVIVTGQPIDAVLT